jgi:hypothetical protein
LHQKFAAGRFDLKLCASPHQFFDEGGANARSVSLCFDNTTADPIFPGLAHNGFPDEISGQFSRITWQTGS